VFGLPSETATSFFASTAHRFPPPTWQPNGAGTVVEARVERMSDHQVAHREDRRRARVEVAEQAVLREREDARGSPSSVVVPGRSGGRRRAPWKRTFGLFG
jgi:hypothetical protein